jgi:hypothetical protein
VLSGLAGVGVAVAAGELGLCLAPGASVHRFAKLERAAGDKLSLTTLDKAVHKPGQFLYGQRKYLILNDYL